jgi:hypothetical protein
MADTFTSSNRFTAQEIGGHASTWGDILNTVIGLIDDSLDGVITVDVSAANVTLSTNNGAADEARVRVLQVIGNTAGTQRTITVPDQDKWYLVHNMTSVSTSVTFKNTSGTGTVINPGVRAIVYCDTASTRTFLESAASVAVLPIASGGTSASTAASARTEFGLGNLATVSVNVANSLLGTNASGTPVSVSVRNPIRVSSAVLQIDNATSASAGVIQVATTAQVQTGTATAKAVDPAGMKGALGFSTYYESGGQTVTVGSQVALTHSLGARPVLAVLELACSTANGGYSPGDRVALQYGAIDGSPASGRMRGYCLTYNTTNIYITTGFTDITIPDKDGNTSLTITPSSWKFHVRAWV